MKIAMIDVYQRELPVQGRAYRMSHADVVSLDTTVVRIVTDTGMTGWGETCPIGPTYQPHHAGGARAALAEMAPGLIGQNPLTIELARTAMDQRLAGHGYAKAALDTALWDLAGHHYDARVCDLLGGARQERLPSYYAIGVSEPEETAAIAREKVAEGFSRIQVKLGGRPIEVDIAALHAVHDAVGGSVRLAADANRGWSSRDTLLFSNACADIAVVLEQPCNRIDEIVSIRAQLHHPVYLDENTADVATVIQAIAVGVCDGFGLKLTRVGGISAMRTIRDICAARSLPHTCDDAWGGDIIAAACVHIGATVQPELLDGVWIAAPYIAEHYASGGGIAIRDGFIDVPRGAGLGLDIDPAVFGEPVARYS